MPLTVIKQPHESSYNLLRRFTAKIKKSGILLEVKRKMFKKREKSKQLKRHSALRREEKKQYYEKLKKLGRLKNV